MPLPDTTTTTTALPGAAALTATAGQGAHQPQADLRAAAKGAAPDSAATDSAAAHAPTIRYSQRPDTLHLPGYPIGRSPRQVSLTQYWREGFFAADTTATLATPAGGYGVAGHPLPRSLRSDDAVTLALLACFAIALTAISRSSRFIVRQAKGLLHTPGDNRADVAETSAEVRFQLFLVLQTCLLLALLQHSYTTTFIGTTAAPGARYLLMGAFMAAFVAYFALKALLYAVANTTFFGRLKSRLWLKSQLFLTAAEGVLLFPVVLLTAYFDIRPAATAWWVAIVLIIVKMLALHKCKSIFFKRPNGFLQIILYFCTLEMVPLAGLWAALVEMGNYLTTNF